jgi:hypothetical protein
MQVFVIDLAEFPGKAAEVVILEMHLFDTAVIHGLPWKV